MAENHKTLVRWSVDTDSGIWIWTTEEGLIKKLREQVATEISTADIRNFTTQTMLGIYSEEGQLHQLNNTDRQIARLLVVSLEQQDWEIYTSNVEMGHTATWEIHWLTKPNTRK